MFDLQKSFLRRWCRQLAVILAVLAIVMAGWPVWEGGALSHAGIFDIFKSKSKRTPPPEEANKQRDLLRMLQIEHDSEPDPARKITYDRKIVSLLDPYMDFEKIKNVQNEIKQHEAEMRQRERRAQQLAKEQERRQAMRQASQALAEHRYEEAEQAALRAIQIQDDAQAQRLLTEVRTRRLTAEVKDLLVRNDIDKANEKHQQALQLAPNDPEVRTLRRDIDNALAKRKTTLALKVGFMITLIAGLLVGLYFLLQPRKWVLTGIDGACQGQVFPLDMDEVKIGAMGPPEGECDIVIGDTMCKISHLHCVIMRNGRHLYLADESTNGTRINNMAVEKGSSVRLRKGDQIALADGAVFVLQGFVA
jgi:tetratricopeptide (TPR) repeat protein